ncbi:MAG TPA: VanZ family protein [Bryobacteraceae bacterium]|nr:VanZ family protein [Bryobacteraceae bacterium]
MIVALIVYGSLYPWRLRDPGPKGPLEILLQSRSGPFLLGDILVNIAIYIPIGGCAYLAFRRSVLKPVLLGVALSATIELIQVYQVSRRPSIYDLLANGVGTMLGVAVGSMFAATSNRLRAAHAGALVILGCWIAYLCYPYVFDPSSLAAKSGAFLRSNPVALIPLVSAFASWFAAGLLFSEAGFRDVRRWLIASLAFIPLQLFLVGRQPKSAQAIGAFAGVATFLSMNAIRTRLAPLALLAALFVRGCAPFHFQPVAGRFSRFQRSVLRNSGCGSSPTLLLLKAIGSGWERAIASKPYLFSGKVIRYFKCQQVHSSEHASSGLCSLSTALGCTTAPCSNWSSEHTFGGDPIGA